MAEKRQGESEVEHPRKKNCFAVRRPSLAVVDVLRPSGRAAVPQYCKLRLVACGASRQRRSRVQLVQRFEKIPARKPRFPTTKAPFWRSIAG